MNHWPICGTLLLALAVSAAGQESSNLDQNRLSKELNSIVDWKIVKPLPSELINIQHCSGSTQRNPQSVVCELSYPRLASEHSQTSADTIPPVREIATRVKSVLLKSGWRKCTPGEGDGDYYNNEGPWMMSTYIKDKSLLQLNVSYSQGVGYQIAIQYECEPPLPKPTSK
jgi:hypothetical protein